MPLTPGTGLARYLVLELVDGETLADRLARGPLPLAEYPERRFSSDP